MIIDVGVSTSKKYRKGKICCTVTWVDEYLASQTFPGEHHQTRESFHQLSLLGMHKSIYICFINKFPTSPTGRPEVQILMFCWQTAQNTAHFVNKPKNNLLSQSL